MTTQRLAVDSRHLCFRGNVELFADPPPPAAGEALPDKIPLTLKVRSPDAVFHWYWGKVIHDMSGVKLPQRCCLDWEHGSAVLGYCDSFKATDVGGLEASGALVPYGEQDIAREIAHKAARGVPYQASIDFRGSGVVLEWVDEGETQIVNGQNFDGPGYVVREWPLMSIAICKKGVDTNTAATFSADSPGKAGPAIDVQIRGDKQGPLMSQSPPKAGIFSREDAVKELGRFSQIFGSEAGASHFSAGRSLLEAYELEFSAMKEKQAGELKAVREDAEKELTKLRDEVSQLSAKLEAASKLSAGQAPLSGSGEGKDNGTKKPLVRISGRTAS